MKLPMQVTFKGLDHSDALQEVANTCARTLEERCPTLIGCRLLVEATGKHHRKGGSVQVRLDVTIPRHEVVATQDVAHSPGHADVQTAIKAVFHSAEHQCTEHSHAERHPRDRERISDVLKPV